MKQRIMFVCVVASALVAAGCSSGGTDAPAPATSSAAADSSDVVAAAANGGGSDFCSLFAARVAKGLVNIREAQAGGVVVAENIATSLAAQPDVSDDQLQAVAPPEPQALLKAMAEADAAGAAGDYSQLDGLMTKTVALNDWAIANCGDDYAPVFQEYKGVIG